MSTYTLPRVGLSGLRELPDAPPPPPPQPPIAPPDDDEPPLRDQVDALVKENRKRATPDVLEKRKIPRVSISELNAMDLDQIRERFHASSFDGRGPVTKVLDLLDLSRNQVAGLMFPTLAKRAKERGEVGAFGSGSVNGADILRDMGVNNNVIAGVGGFALDFAMDPLTYVGPAGWAARLATTAKSGKGAVMAIRGAGNRALRRSIKDVARGGAARDAVWAPVIADAGYDAAKVAELAASGKTAKQIRAEIDAALRGPLESGRVGRVFSGIGGDLEYEGGHLNRMFNQTPLEAGLDDATVAKVRNVRNAVKKYGKGTGPSLRLGVEKGAVGSEIAHIPFTDITLQVPSFSSATGQAIKALRIANGLESGLTRAAVVGDTAARAVAHHGDGLAAKVVASEANSEPVTAAREAHAAETFGLPPDEPPPEPPAGPDFLNPKDRPPAPPPGGPLFNPDAPRSPGDVAPGGTPKPAETPGAVAEIERDRAFSEMAAAFTPEVARPYQAFMDANARAWAAGTGKSTEDYYARFKFEKGGAPEGDALFDLPAWHGSPHRFDKFSTDAIGTGEGAQSYGHGLYFSSSEDVAKHYRKALSKENPSFVKSGRELSYSEVLREYFKPGRDVPGYGGTDRVLRFNEDPNLGWSVEVAKVKPDGGLERPRIHYTSPSVAEIVTTLRREGVAIKPGGRLYKVELAPEPHELLDWNKPLRDQSPHVRAAIESLSPQPIDGFNPADTGEDIYKSLAPGTDGLGPAEASDELRQLGIRGIRYRGHSSDVENYVIFDDADISIQEMFQRQAPEGARGSYSMLKSGDIVIRALTNPDASTLPHETAHAFLDLLKESDPDLYRQALDSIGAAGMDAPQVVHHEAWARGFEDYLRTGEAPSDILRVAFQRFRAWLLDIYESIVGTELEGKLNPELKAVFDRMLTAGDEGLSAADEATDVAAVKAGRPRRSAAVLGSKAEIMRRLEGLWGGFASAESEFYEAAGRAERAAGGPGQAVEFSTSFMGPVPTEIKEALQGQRYLLSKVHGNVVGGAGEDSWSELGHDEWIRRLRIAFEGKETAVLRAANGARGHDPVTTLYMHLLDNWPWKEIRVKKAAVDLDELEPDTAFTINGEQFLVVTDENGDTAIRYADGPDVPPEAIGEFGIDAGSLRVLSEDEAIEMAAELSPPLPERPDLMFQGPRDVPGQAGLFTGRPTTGVTGGQRTLGLEPPPPPATPDPMARLPGESDEDFQLRVKWTKPSVIQGTDTLFQGPTGPLTPEERDALRTQGDTPRLPPYQDIHTGPGGATGAAGTQEPLIPLTPRQVADTRLAEAEARYAARRDEILAEAQADRDAIAAAMASLDPKEAAKSLSSADRMIVFGRELEEAQAAVDALAVEKSQLDRAKGLLGKPGAFDESKKAETLRGMSERFYNLAKTNPEALEDVIRLNADAFAAKGKYADALRGVLATFEDGPMTAARLHAMSILGTDDYNIAVTLFNPMGRWSRRKLGDDHALTRTLFGLDNAVRKTFGVRGGALERNLVHYKLGMKDLDRESVRVSKAMESDVGRALAKSGVKGPDATNDAMAIVHAEMYRLADPDGSVYHWTKWGDKGPEGPSLLLDKLEAAKAKGYFDPKTHPGLLDDLKAIAQKQIDEYRQIGDSELRDFTLGSLMAGHVPLVPSRPAARAIREAAGASVQHPGRVSRVGGEGFDHMRTTWQTRFFDPGQVGPTLTDPNAGGRWRRFFHGDRDLAALSKPEFERKFEGRSAAERAEAAEAVEAIKRYDELVAADPAFAEKHPARATDFVEANELYAKGRWRRLTMSDAKVTDFFETNPAHVSGVRMGMHQQSRVKASMLNMVLKNNILLRHEDDLLRVAKDGEQTVRLQSGVVAKVGGLVKTNAGDSAASVLIGDRRYRQLSPGLRSSLDSNPIMEAMGQDAGRMLFPHELADRIEGVVAATATDANLDGVLGMVNAVTSHWKMATLFSPSWAVFNVLGDGIMALAGGARLDHMADPESIRDMWAIRRALNDPAKLAGKTTNVLGREMPMSEVLGLALKHRIFDNSLTIEAASHALLDVEFQRGLMQRLPGYDQLMRRVVGPFFRANQFVQDGMRMLAFASFIRQGHSPVAAEQAVLRSMLDYADFTRVEERYFRTIFPFYSWMRGNLGYQFRMLLERPSYAAAVPRVKEAIEEAVNGEDGVPENMRPTWMREQLATQVGTDPQRRIAVMLGNMLPQGDLFQALTPVVGVDGAMNFMHYFASQLNPALSVPLQLGAGVETFSGRTIGPSREEGDIGAGEFLASQVRPLAEYGPGGRLWKAADEGGAAGAGARFLIGGRSQGFGQDRIDSSLTREYDDRVRRMQAAVHRAERAGDRATSLRARTRLMQVYAEMQGKGLQVPKWAAEQLGTFAE